MSVLEPEVSTALTQLLEGLQSTDNNIRTAAEAELNTKWFAERPEVLLMGLVEQVRDSTSPQVRPFAAVLFKRYAGKSKKTGDNESAELFLTLQPGQQQAIREALLQCLANESTSNVRKLVGDAVAEIARQYADAKQSWEQVLQVLFQLSNSADPGQKENAFRIFATTPGIIEKKHEAAASQVFESGFKDADVTVQIAAMEAFASFFRAIDRKSQRQHYAQVANILNILPPLKEQEDSDNLAKALIALIELAEIAPTMFKALFHNLVQFAISVIQKKELDDRARQNALELMATFADCAAPMCKKDPSYTSDMVTQCLALMTEIGEDDDDAAEWNASDDLDAEESDLNHVAGEQCMDRLANKLGGEVLLVPTFNWLPRMLQSQSWKDRHAALMAISAISEGCHDMMKRELKEVLGLVVPALKDEHPRVRWAGCNALGQMSTDFAGIMQTEYHEIILSNIIPVLSAPEPRVQAHAAAALVNFCEEAESEVLQPYLHNLLSQLMNLLQSDKRFVQEQALSTIATIADSAERTFGEYYGALMPLLFNVLKSEQSKEYRLLRAKAMECATLIALAVGKERMGHDALDLVQLLGTIQQNVKDADDPQGQYLLHCWGRMCKILGHDFLPYLVVVMPPLLELAGAKADITLLDDDEAIANYENDEAWELVPLKGKVIGIKTSLLEEKYMAIEMIVIYAQQLEADFEPYVTQILQDIALPGLAFFFHDPVRVASAKAVPMLLNSYKKKHGERSEQLAVLWNHTLEKILEVLAPENAIDTLAEMYQCFYESVEVIGKECMTPKHMQSFITHAQETLAEYQDRAMQREEERKEVDDGEEDPEEILLAIEEDQQLLSDMNKAFHTIFKNQGLSFLPAWRALLETYQTFVNSQDSTQRQWALCIYDDVLEFTGDHSWDFQQYIRQPLEVGLQDSIPANRQAAAYGVGVAAQKGGSNWVPFCLECLPTLFRVCEIPGAREGDDVYATENASTSIAKILSTPAGKAMPDYNNLVNAWIQTLPVVNDEEAAPFAYMFLAQLIRENHPAIQEKQNAAKAFVAVLKALEADTIQAGTATHVLAAAQALAQQASLDAEGLLSELTPDGQARVRAWFAK